MKWKIRVNDIELKTILIKKARKFSNSAHVLVPKSYTNKKVVVGIPKRQVDLTLTQDRQPKEINFGINPELICPDCGKPWGRPAGKRFKNIKTCDCRRNYSG